MSCVLRASGKTFDVERFLADSTLKPLTVWHTGERQWPSTPAMGTSGFNISASEAAFDEPEQQIADANVFVRSNGAELRRLAKFPGVEYLSIDFGIADRDVPAQSDTFPSELLSALGELNISLTVTRYPEKE